MEKDCRTLGEKVSDSVARFGGSWNFILSGFAIILAWGIINNIYFLPHWDEYPFILLNLFLSLIAAFQAPFILMAQKRVEVKQDAIYRTLFREIKELVEIDLSLEHEVLETNKKLEQEIQLIKQILEKPQDEERKDEEKKTVF
jgi:uncharacterized membrane protein